MPALLRHHVTIQLSCRELRGGLPDVATLVGYVGGPFNARVIERSSTLLTDVIRTVFARTLGQILLLH
jgi:hypothetical protein